MGYSTASNGKSTSTNNGPVQMLKRGSNAAATEASKTEPTITFGSFESQSRSDLPEKAWPGLPGGSQSKTSASAAAAGGGGGPPSLVRKAAATPAAHPTAASAASAKSTSAGKVASSAAAALAAPVAVAASKKPKPSKGMTVADVLFTKASAGKNASKKTAAVADKGGSSGSSKSSKGASELSTVGKKGKSGSFPALPEMLIRGAISLPPKDGKDKKNEASEGGDLPSSAKVEGGEEDKAFKPVEKTKKKKLSSLKKRILLERVSRWEATHPPILDAKDTSAGGGTADSASGAAGLTGSGAGPKDIRGVGDNGSSKENENGTDISLCSPGFEALVKLRGIVCVADVADEDEYAELLENLAQLIVPLRFQSQLTDVQVPRQSEDSPHKTADVITADADGAASSRAEVSPDAMVVVTLRFGRSVSAAQGCAEALAGTLVGGRSAHAEWAVVATSDEDVGLANSGNSDSSSASSDKGASSTAAEEVQAGNLVLKEGFGEGRAALVVRQFADEDAVTDPDEREELLENLDNLARRLPGFLVAILPTHSSRSNGSAEGHGEGCHRDGDDDDEALSLARATNAEPGDAALGFNSGATAEAAAATLRLLVVGGAPLQTEVVPWPQASGQSEKGDECSSNESGQNETSITPNSGSNGSSSAPTSTIISSDNSIASSSNGDGPGVVWLLELVQSLDEVIYQSVYFLWSIGRNYRLTTMIF